MPTITPQIIAKLKSRMTAPPKMISASRASSVVIEVMTVRARVSLTLWLSSSRSGIVLYLRRFSRTRS